MGQARTTGRALGREIWSRFPFVPETRPLRDDPLELVLNRSWRPALAITGATDLPAPADAGNVVRPKTTLKLSLRLPPTVDAARATWRLKELLTACVSQILADHRRARLEEPAR